MDEKIKGKKKASSKIQIVELDYNKLADAIVKAEIKVKEDKKIDLNDKKKLSKLKLFWWVLIGKTPKEIDLSSEKFLSMYSSLFLSVIAFVERFIAYFSIIALPLACVFKVNWEQTQILTNIVVIILIIVFSIILLLLATVTKATEKDIEKEKDKNYLVSFFSGLVSFVALIVAIIALIK